MVKELLKACPSSKGAVNSTQPKKPQRGGPVAQDQTSSQLQEPQGTSRLWRGATVRTVHYFHSTAQPQVSHGLGQVSSCGCFFRGSGRRSGGRVGGGGRPVHNGNSSLRTQAGLKPKGVEPPGKESG